MIPRHRIFEVRAGFDPNAGRWLARVAEQNPNEQCSDWEQTALTGDQPTIFPTAATCLGNVVTTIVAAVAEADAVVAEAAQDVRGARKFADGSAH